MTNNQTQRDDRSTNGGTGDSQNMRTGQSGARTEMTSHTSKDNTPRGSLSDGNKQDRTSEQSGSSREPGREETTRLS